MGSGLTAAVAPLGWTVEERVGSAASLFDAATWVGVNSPTVRVLKVSAPTIVLGSSQSFDVIDVHACAEAGVEVVRRRSGGGAVWLDDDMLWVDVFVPAGHLLWDADIGRSMWWLGEAWADSLAAVGVAGAEVHRGALVRTQWSSLVCFAGLGPGEVSIAGRKVVGISQRRTRAGALFQCGVVRRWDPERFLSLLSFEDVDRVGQWPLAAAIESVSVGLGTAPDDALPTLLQLLERRP